MAVGYKGIVKGGSQAHGASTALGRSTLEPPRARPPPLDASNLTKPRSPFRGSFFYAWRSPMKKNATAAEAGPAPAIIVFGLDEGQRPHASWFAEPDAVLAEKAAGLMNMQVLRVTTPEHRSVALELATGRVFASGKGFVPFVAKGTYDRLAAFEGAFKPVPATTPAEPMPEPTNVPATWSEIGAHSLVLAADDEVQGWYEAVVVEAKGDLFGLRWLAWPELPPFVRRGEHLSLMSAASLEAMRGQAAGEP